MEFLRCWWCLAKDNKCDDGKNIQWNVMTENARYCCSQRCFDKGIVGDEVDGVACGKCLAFCSCMCKCKSYMKYVYKNKLEKQKRDAIKELKEIQKKYKRTGIKISWI